MKTNYINRDIESVITEASDYYSVISITGPRQSGKSTLLRHLFPNYKEYSMKDVHIRDFAINDPVAFLQQTTDGMFIDEIQKAPVLMEYIQGIVDHNPERKFLLTGSSNFEMMRDLSESLAGRAGIFELMPMSLHETIEHRTDSDLSKLLYNGLYPAVCADKNTAKYFYPSYVKTYIEKDVRDFLNVQNQMQFIRFIKLCATRIGSLFNASELASEVGVESKTITRWLSVLQASYIVTLLPPYYENIPKRLIKSPKLYFNDTGLACYLLDIESSKQLDRDKMRGALFENMIVMETIKHRFNQGKDGGVFFYRDSNQNEVDIILLQEGEITALEIKSSMTYHQSFEDTLQQLPGWIKTPVTKKAVIYTGDFENSVSDINLLNYNNMNQLFI
ncbi:MAG: ATP-binding protein [Bacteroidales bacterium]|nr:ATP-binding protein [Bacteroidales bacterium]